MKSNIHLICKNSFSSVGPLEHCDETLFKLFRVRVQKLVRRLREDQQLPLVSLAHRVTLEPVFISEIV